MHKPDVVRGGEPRDILEVYRMYAYDRGWVRKIEEAISTGLTAEAAVERVQNETLARLLMASGNSSDCHPLVTSANVMSAPAPGSPEYLHAGRK